MIQIACHAEGRHYLAVGARGGAWSWGFGGKGRLGLGDNRSRDRPTRIPTLRGHHVIAVAAGPISRYFFECLFCKLLVRKTLIFFNIKTALQ